MSICFQPWLSDIQYEELDGNEIEPPVPPGLSKLNPALQNLVEFLGIDCDLLEVACKKSLQLEEAIPSSEYIHNWLKTLSTSKNDDILLNILKKSLCGDFTPAIKLSQSVNKSWSELRNLTCVENAQEYKKNLIALRTRHARKTSFIDRLQRVNLN